MSEQEQHNADVQFMKECVISDVIKLLIEDKGLDIEGAMQLFYTSETFAKLDNEQTQLYTQSPLYLYDLLQSELTAD